MEDIQLVVVTDDLNYLFVVMDSVRAHNVGHLGYERNTTPRLDEFAEFATVYTQARAPDVWSLPSHVSMFTGLHTPEHRIRNFTTSLAPGNTVFDDLRTRGYSTACFSTNQFLTDPNFGIADSFDEVYSRANIPFANALAPRDTDGEGAMGFLKRALRSESPVGSILNGIGRKLYEDHRGALQYTPLYRREGIAYAQQFIDWADGQSGSWAACVNLMDAHTHYHPVQEHDHWANGEAWEAQKSYEDGKWEFVSGKQPWDLREQVVDLYDGAIRQTDAAVGRIVSWLADTGRLDDTVVVVTADHGETFGEPDDILPTRLSGHGFGMCEQLVHVPLVVWRPDRSGSERVDDPVSLTALSELPFSDDKIVDIQMPVIVTSDGLNGTNRTERAANHLDTSELDPFHGEIRVRYDVHAGRIRKHITHADEYISYEFNDGWSCVDAPTAERIDAVFGGLEDAGVAATDRAVTNDTRSRLRDLGYM